MSAIKKPNDNELRRDPVSSDRTTVYTDGYKNLFNDATPVTIQNIIDGYWPTGLPVPGQIRLSNAYIPGTDNLQVKINGVELLQPGVDFTEIDNQTIQLSPFHLGNLDPVDSVIKVVWNRPLPGARDQELNNLRDVDPDLANAIKDVNTLRSYASATNPLATLADIGGGAVPLVGKTFVPVTPAERYGGEFLNVPGPDTANQSGSIDLLTAGGARTIPVGATHVLLTAAITDINITAGIIIGRLFIGPSGTSFPDFDYKVAEVNGGVPNGLDSHADTGSILVSIEGGTTLDWYFHNSLGSTYDTLKADFMVEGFYVDELGRSPAPISFEVAQDSSTAQSISNGTGEAAISLVQIDNVRSNIGGGFSTVSNLFTAPLDGVYFFNARVTYASVPDTVGIAVTLGKNVDTAAGIQGTEQWYGGTSPINGAGSPSLLSAEVSATISLVAGDTVGLYTQHTHGSPLSLSVIGPGLDFEGSGVRFEGHLIAGAGTTALPLEGKTYVPVTPESDQTVLAGTMPASWSGGSDHINLIDEGVTVPANATHARVRVVADVNNSSGSGDFNLYVARWTGAAVNTIENLVGILSINGVDNDTLDGSRIVELNPVPAAPATNADITLQTTYAGTHDITGGSYWVFVEGFYIDDSGAAVINPAGTESFSVGFGGQFLSNTSDITPEKVSAGAVVGFDLDSNWDVGLTRYSVPEDGVYFFAFSVANSTRVDGDLQALLYVDGSGASGGSTGPAGGSGGAVSTGTAMLQLTAGQFVELYGSSSATAGETVSGKIEGYRIA